MAEEQKAECVNVEGATPAQVQSMGCLLGQMMGDCLGSAVEGWPKNLIKMHFNGVLRDMVPGKHMGTNFIRKGFYTDDTNAMLALATSLVENGGLDPGHAAKQYGIFWQSEPVRGYPDSAKRVMRGVLNGEDWRKTGTVCFKDGSYANGGAMRIAPMGVAFRNADDANLLNAVKYAIRSSHVHPQSIDGAWVVAKVISYFMTKREEALALDGLAFLKMTQKWSQNDEMKKNIAKIISLWPDTDDLEMVLAIGNQFQIRATEAVPCALWCVAQELANPEECIIRAVNLGGDTDTVGAIAGGMIGALHGTSWLPKRWYDVVENGERGRDFVVATAKKLGEMDLKTFVYNEEKDMPEQKK